MYVIYIYICRYTNGGLCCTGLCLRRPLAVYCHKVEILKKSARFSISSIKWVWTWLLRISIRTQWVQGGQNTSTHTDVQTRERGLFGRDSLGTATRALQRTLQHCNTYPAPLLQHQLQHSTATHAATLSTRRNPQARQRRFLVRDLLSTATHTAMHITTLLHVPWTVLKHKLLHKLQRCNTCCNTNHTLKSSSARERISRVTKSRYCTTRTATQTELKHTLELQHRHCNRFCNTHCNKHNVTESRYGVASVGRIDKIIGLFGKRALLKRQYSAKETHNFIDPTDHSHPILHYTYCNTNWTETHSWTSTQTLQQTLQHTATHATTQNQNSICIAFGNADSWLTALYINIKVCKKK